MRRADFARLLIRATKCIGAAILTAPGSPDPYIWIMGHLSSTFAPEEWWMIERFRLKHAAVFNIGGGKRLG